MQSTFGKLTLALALLGSALAASGADVVKENWDWSTAMIGVAKKGKGKNIEGVTLSLGDSITYANQSTRWSASWAKGHTPEDKAILKWSHAFVDKSNKNGWWLARVDRPRGRSETAASGIRTGQYIKGGHHGLPSLKAILDKFKPQVVFILLGTNDASAKLQPPAVAKNMETILDTCIANGTVPVLQLLAPMANDSKHELVKQYNKLYVELAKKKKIPIIDLYGEFLSRAPNGAWKKNLLSDGIHFTHKLAGGPPTKENLAKCGYLLRCWLAVQKLKEVKAQVIDKAK